MAQKTTKEPIMNGLEETHIVEKSRPLMLMRDVPFNLGEFKVLDTYLSRINARDPSACAVRFSKDEYEDLMGIERMHPKRLNKYVGAMHGKYVTVPDETARGGWRNYSLFDESAFEQDENGQWWVELCCTQKAKDLFFNIDKIGYVRYQLKNILPLTSKYSILLYLYLLDNRFRYQWTISIDELKNSVLRATEPMYDEFKYLNQRILKKSLIEVNEKTDLHFEHQLIRTGKRVTGIQFTLIKDKTALPAGAVDPSQMTIDDVLSEEDKEYELDILRDKRGEICSGFEDEIFAEFTDEQLTELRSLAWNMVDPDEVEREKHILGDMVMAKGFVVAGYIRQKILMCNAKGKEVKSRYGYIKGAVADDWR